MNAPNKFLIIVVWHVQTIEACMRDRKCVELTALSKNNRLRKGGAGSHVTHKSRQKSMTLFSINSSNDYNNNINDETNNNNKNKNNNNDNNNNNNNDNNYEHTYTHDIDIHQHINTWRKSIP